MVDMAADPERQVGLLRLEPVDLPLQDIERVGVVVARGPEELLVARVPRKTASGRSRKTIDASAKYAYRSSSSRRLDIRSPAAAASTTSSVSTAPGSVAGRR